ncbi:uncharacterized protein LOC134399681 [Elgaria multicarinata webbii]|uniref:uncharacterized protein LOC134399681 n=1 Tax=Elgaria multicarinata webbii TaxID=159646 RepID=UPI002FCD436B
MALQNQAGAALPATQSHRAPGLLHSLTLTHLSPRTWCQAGPRSLQKTSVSPVVAAKSWGNGGRQAATSVPLWKMEPGPADHKSLVLVLSQAQDRLRALQKCQWDGLADARRTLEDALAAVLQREEQLWAQARERRAQLQQQLAAVQGANEEAWQAGVARIQALQQQLSSFHTGLLACPGAGLPAERAQEAADLLSRSTGLALKLSWAHFMPHRGAPALGELHLEEQTLSWPASQSPARARGGCSDSVRPQETGVGARPDPDPELCRLSEPLQAGGTPPLEAGRMGRREKGGKGKAAPPPAEGRALGTGEAETGANSTPGSRLDSGEPTTNAGACEKLAERRLLVAEAAETATAAESILGRAPGSLPLEPGTLFHARAVWVQEDASDSSSAEMGGSGHFRDVAVLGSRVPSAKEPFPRWASADSLGGSCVELAERAFSPGLDPGVSLGGTWQGEPPPAAPPSQKQNAALPWATPGPSKGLAVQHAQALLPRSLRAPPPPPDKLVGHWGHWGRKPGQLCLPHGLSAGRSGSLYVVDCGNRRLQELGGARLVLPLRAKAYFDVAQGRAGCLALTNATWRCVELYSARGVLLHAMSEGFRRPRGVAASVHGEFLVADTHLGSLHVLVASGGQLWRRATVPGFHKPYLVATNTLGEVAVSERGLDGGCCVKVLGPTWQLLRVLGGASRPPLLTNPWGVSLDEAGRVLVADWGRHSHAVLCYPRRGLGWAVVTQGLSSPRGVTLLGERHLVVADSMHHCLKTFRYC